MEVMCLKKRFGDRKDAVRVRNMDGMHMLMCDIKPNRCDADVYINKKIDVTNLVKYMKKQKKNDIDLTYFHVFCTAIAKVIYNRPLLNRYVLNRRYYDRRDVTISFVAKVEFNDDALEYMNVIKINKSDNLMSIKNKIIKVVSSVRDNKESDTDGVIKIVGRFPKFLRSFIVWVVKKLDNFDLVPSFITNNLIYNSSIILSNLGSLNCDAIYHNLTDFGTNSIIMTIGNIHKEQVVMDDGKVVMQGVPREIFSQVEKLKE